MPDPVQVLAERVRNQETMEALSPELVIAQYLLLPGLRAFWPMSSVSWLGVDQARDFSGGGLHLTNNNSADFGYDGLAPYVDFDGVNQYLSRADGGAGNWADIVGTETYIVAAQRGLTTGGWWYFDSVAATPRLVSKNDGIAAATSSYLLYGGGTANFAVYSGANTYAVTGSALTTGTWYYIVGRYVPSIERAIFVNNVVATNNAPATPANINDSAAPVEIGATAGTRNLSGKASLVFLCAAALSDEIILALFQQSRGLFGV